MQKPGKDQNRIDPQVRRPAIAYKLNPGGVPRRKQVTANAIPIRALTPHLRAEGVMHRIQIKDTSHQPVGQAGNPTQQMTLCTICPHKGTACQAGFALMAKLEKSIASAGDSLADDFEIAGYAELTGCDRRCLIAYHGSKGETYLFGDVEENADIDALVAYAKTQQAPLNRGDYPPVPAPLTQTPASVMAMGKPGGQTGGHTGLNA